MSIISSKQRMRKKRMKTFLGWFMSFFLALMILGSGVLSVVHWAHESPDTGDANEQSFVPVAHAGDAPDEKDQAPATGDQGSQGPFGYLGAGLGGVISGLATVFIKILSGLLWFVLYWIGPLMDNTFILEGEIGEKIHSVWIIVRNFVNIFFALALVVVALMAVVGYGEESGNYAIKKFIPKLALALIAVNFTFLGAKLVLDVNNVLTTAVFAIPQSVTNLSDIAPSGLDSQYIFRKMKCFDQQENYEQQLKKNQDLQKKFENVISSLGGICFAVDPDAMLKINDLEALKVAKHVVSLGSTGLSKKDFVWAMATQFQGIHNLNLVSQLVDSRSFTNLTVSAIFSIIFAVIYGTAYVAMFIILLGRMIVLWITIMLSPLVAISIVIPDILPQELNIKDKFLAHAFVPLKMAIPLSFGYILISQMTLALDVGSNIIQENTLDLSTGGEFARSISFTTLLYGAASVGVIWMAVFMASKDVVGSGLVEKLKGTMESAGSTVAKWPAYIPFMPVPGAGHLGSLETFRHILGEAKHTIAEKARQHDESLARQALSHFGLPMDEIYKAKTDLMRIIESGRMDDQAKVRQLVQKVSSDPRIFGDVMRSASKMSDPNHVKVFAEATGRKSVDEFKTHVGNDVQLEDMRDKARSGSGGGGAGKIVKDYSNFEQSLEGDVQFSLEKAEVYKPDTRSAMNIGAETKGKAQISISRFLPGLVKIERDQRIGMLIENKEQLKKIVDGTEQKFVQLKGQLKEDGDFKAALSQCFSGDQSKKDQNKTIYDFYSSIYGKVDADAFVKDKNIPLPQ